MLVLHPLFWFIMLMIFRFMAHPKLLLQVTFLRHHSRHKRFQELLLGGAFSCFSIPTNTPLEEILFQIPAGLFRSFLASIEDVQPDCQSLSAQVLSKEFESFTFTFDSGANKRASVVVRSCYGFVCELSGCNSSDYLELNNRRERAG